MRLNLVKIFSLSLLLFFCEGRFSHAQTADSSNSAGSGSIVGGVLWYAWDSAKEAYFAIEPFSGAKYSWDMWKNMAKDSPLANFAGGCIVGAGRQFLFGNLNIIGDILTLSSGTIADPMAPRVSGVDSQLLATLTVANFTYNFYYNLQAVARDLFGETYASASAICSVAASLGQLVTLGAVPPPVEQAAILRALTNAP